MYTIKNLSHYIMYLIHNTLTANLLDIITDGYLRSSSQTGNINEGEGIYEPHQQKFVFFSTTPYLFDEYVYYPVTLYFKIQKNRTLYIANHHSADPAHLSESDDKKHYSRKISAHEPLIRKQRILMGLYKESVRILPNSAFFALHQVAIKDKYDLRNLVAISFGIFSPRDTAYDDIIKVIKLKYPHVKIKIF